MRLTPSSDQEFWITNISKQAINLVDLGIYIYPMHSINLLDKRHYRGFTKEQLLASAASGSLFAKRKFVVVRKFAPGTPMKSIPPFQQDAVFPTRQRSNVEIDHKTYDELIVKDEEYAEENADIAQEDHLGKWSK